MKFPVPLPSFVLVSLIVGVEVVDQHTPRFVTGVPPSFDTFPPELAVVADVATALIVVSVGIVNVLIVS